MIYGKTENRIEGIHDIRKEGITELRIYVNVKKWHLEGLG